MRLLAYVAQNLAGAWLLMRGRPEGLNRLDLSLEGFWRSFAAIVLVAPAALLAALSQGWFADAAAAGAPPDPNLPLTLLALAVDWTAFPLLFAVLARPLGLGARYVPFIAARNWAAVIVSAMVAVLHALHLAGVLPAQPVAVLLLVTLGITLRFSYLLARTSLLVPPAMAAPVVVVDFLVSLLVWEGFARLH